MSPQYVALDEELQGGVRRQLRMPMVAAAAIEERSPPGGGGAPARRVGSSPRESPGGAAAAVEASSSTSRDLVAIFLLAACGAIFVFRYGARLLDRPEIAALVYAAGAVAVLWALRARHVRGLARPRSRALLAGALLAVTALALAVVVILPEESRVSRFPAIVEWIERLSDGQFPWGRDTVLNPSGFPVLFLVAWPFHLLGNAGLLEVVAVALLATALWRLSGSAGEGWLRLTALLLLPSFYYELLVRSDLLFNMALAIGLMLLAERYLSPHWTDIGFVVLGLGFGLALSTRAVVALVFAAYFAYRFRDDLRRGAVFAGLTLLGFAASLVPFLLWDPATFLADGPFSVQSAYLHPVLAVAFAGLAVAAGVTARRLDTVLFRVGVLLFGAVLAALVPSLLQGGAEPLLARKGFDVGYFVLCTPFLVLSLAGGFQPHVRPPAGDAGSKDPPADHRVPVTPGL